MGEKEPVAILSTVNQLFGNLEIFPSTVLPVTDLFRNVYHPVNPK